MDKADIETINKRTRIINEQTQKTNKKRNDLTVMLEPLNILFNTRGVIKDNIGETIENELIKIDMTFYDDIDELCKNIKIYNIYCEARTTVYDGSYNDNCDGIYAQMLLCHIPMNAELWYVVEQFREDINAEQIKILQKAIDKLEHGEYIEKNNVYIGMTGGIEKLGSEFIKDVSEIIIPLVNKMFPI